MISIVRCKKPRGYTSKNVIFFSLDNANKYEIYSKKIFLINRAKMLEMNFSNKKIKDIKNLKQKRLLLTNFNKKYLLWEKI